MPFYSNAVFRFGLTPDVAARYTLLQNVRLRPVRMRLANGWVGREGGELRVGDAVILGARGCLPRRVMDNRALRRRRVAACRATTRHTQHLYRGGERPHAQLRQPQEDGTDGVREGKRGWAVRVFGSSRREAHRVQKEGYNSGKANTRLEPRHGSKGGTAPALYRGVAWGK